MPGYYVNTDFHSVWRDPDGNLVDVTPSEDVRDAGDDRILFVPDTFRRFAGKLILGPFVTLCHEPEFLDLLQRVEAATEARAARLSAEVAGEWKRVTAGPSLSPKERAEKRRAMRRKAKREVTGSR
jgi:hypothetical protein